MNELLCNIDISAYPLNNVSIIFPIKAPNSENYNFTNWETIIGAQPGTSNVFTYIKCLPKETNTFIPSNITIKDCDKSGLHPFSINGDWEKYNKNKDNLMTDYLKATIFLDNNNKDMVNCSYRNKQIRFDCKFNDETPLKFKEQHVKILLQSFKIKAFDSGKILTKCKINDNKSDRIDGVDKDDEDDDDWVDFIGSAITLNLNKILIVICLLLF